MKQLFKEFMKDHICLAVGIDTDGWYVQTSDVQADTHYSEPIENGLETKAEALAIANQYAKQYDLRVVVWDNPELAECEACGGSGFDKAGTGYDAVCDACGGLGKYPK